MLQMRLHHLYQLFRYDMVLIYKYHALRDLPSVFPGIIIHYRNVNKYIGSNYTLYLCGLNIFQPRLCIGASFDWIWIRPKVRIKYNIKDPWHLFSLKILFQNCWNGGKVFGVLLIWLYLVNKEDKYRWYIYYL